TADRSADNGLSDAVISGDGLNGEAFHVGPVSADAAGNTLYVTRTYVGKDGERSLEERRKYRTHNLELYIYSRGDGGSWEAVPFPYNDVERYSVGHASLSEDGTTLYYVSDMPGGRGGTDIWYSERRADGSWGDPVNAGGSI